MRTANSGRELPHSKTFGVLSREMIAKRLGVREPARHSFGATAGSSGALAQATDTWEPAPEALSISSEELHVWRAQLAVSYDELRTFQQLLSTEEQQRATAFHFEEH